VCRCGVRLNPRGVEAIAATPRRIGENHRRPDAFETKAGITNGGGEDRGVRAPGLAAKASMIIPSPSDDRRQIDDRPIDPRHGRAEGQGRRGPEEADDGEAVVAFYRQRSAALESADA